MFGGDGLMGLAHGTDGQGRKWPLLRGTSDSRVTSKACSSCCNARLSPPTTTSFCGTLLAYCLAPPFPAESASAPQPPRCCAVSAAPVQCTTCAFDGLPRCAHDDAWLHPADGRSLSCKTARLYLLQALSQCF